MKPNQNKTKGDKRILEVMEISVTMIVVLVSEAFAFVQAHQIYLLNMCSFWISIIHLDKAVKTKKTLLASFGGTLMCMCTCMCLCVYMELNLYTN